MGQGALRRGRSAYPPPARGEQVRRAGDEEQPEAKHLQGRRPRWHPAYPQGIQDAALLELRAAPRDAVHPQHRADGGIHTPVPRPWRNPRLEELLCRLRRLWRGLLLRRGVSFTRRHRRPLPRMRKAPPRRTRGRTIPPGHQAGELRPQRAFLRGVPVARMPGGLRQCPRILRRRPPREPHPQPGAVSWGDGQALPP